MLFNCCIFIQVTVPTGRFNSQSEAAALKAEDNGNPGTQQQLESKAEALPLGWRHSGRSAGSHGPGLLGRLAASNPARLLARRLQLPWFQKRPATKLVLYCVVELLHNTTHSNMALFVPPFAVSYDMG